MKQRGRDEPLLRIIALSLVALQSLAGSSKEYESGRDGRESKGLIRVAVIREHEEESR
jgi:hypothetical protein